MIEGSPCDRRAYMTFLVYVNRKLMKPLEECFHGKYTSLQLRVLCALEAGGPMSLSELAFLLHLPKQQMSRMIETLAEGGILHCQVDSCDRRRRLIGLANRAREELENGFQEFEEKTNTQFSGLSSLEQKEFTEALHTLNRLLIKLPAEGPGSYHESIKIQNRPEG